MLQMLRVYLRRRRICFFFLLFLLLSGLRIVIYYIISIHCYAIRLCTSVTFTKKLSPKKKELLGKSIVCCVHFLDRIQRVGNLNSPYEIIEHFSSPITRVQKLIYVRGLFRFLNLYHLSQFHFSKKEITTHYIM